jgi:hypothetical protein
MHIDAPLGDVEERSKIVDTVSMVGVIMRVKDTIDVVDPGVDQLLADVWWRVNENARVSVFANALH